MIGKNLCFIIINEVLPTFKDKFYAGIQKGLGCQRSWEFLLKPYILVIKVYFFSITLKCLFCSLNGLEILTERI